MGCCKKGIFKWVHLVLCLALIIVSLATCITVYKKQKDKDWFQFIKSNIPFALLLAVMALAIVLGVLGVLFFCLCCCAKCFYILYLIIFIVVVIVEIAAIYVSFKFKEKILDGIGENWNEKGFDEARLALEKSYGCCGFESYNVSIQCGFEDVAPPTCKSKIEDELSGNIKNLRTTIYVLLAIEAVILVITILVICCSGKLGVL